MGSCTLSNLLGAAMRCKYSSGRFSCVYKCVCMSTVYMSYIYMTYITNHVNRDTFNLLPGARKILSWKFCVFVISMCIHEHDAHMYNAYA